MRLSRRWGAPGYALILALLVCAPLLGRGYLLLRDAVSTPRSYLSDGALGLGESAPRAVPQDSAVALASRLLDGGVVVKALLVAALWLAGCGAARLVTAVLPESGEPGRFVAITLAIWNPYVAERLLQGHWSLLVAYGCLPWVAAATLRLRRSGRAATFLGLVFFTALAGLTPTGLLLAVTVALVCAAVPVPGRPRWPVPVAALGVAALAALPWLTAWALGSSCCPAPGAPGAAAFAARAEPGLGTLGSLAGLGGIWNSGAVPGSRTTPWALAATVVLLGVVAAGLPLALRRPPALALLVLAAAAVLVPAAAATGPGVSLLRALLEAVPGLGVVRDAQKWVALAAPGYALAGAAAVLTLRRRCPPAATAALCCAALLAVLPDLAWGVWGKVAPVHYPPGWAATAARVNADPRPVAVLPADSLRRFAWSGPAPVLDPLPRWVRAEVLSTGDLIVSGKTVAGEGAHAREVQKMLLAGADRAALAGAGVGWVIVESDTGGDSGAPGYGLGGLPVVYRDADLTVYRVGGSAAGASPARRQAVLAAHLVWAALLCGGAGGWAVTGRRDPATPRR